MNNLIEQIKKARFIWICGNGGSASTAEHFTADLVKRGYKAICLSSNMSVITMLANDYGYPYVFREQLEIFANEKDLLITFSCSGKSENILNAQNVFINKGWSVYAFPTFEEVEHQDFGILENEHLIMCHQIVKIL